jgi:transcriptional regulator with XRE-family HTH domain
MKTVTVYYPLYLAEALRRRRKREKLSVRRAAKGAAVSSSTFNRAENGEMPDAVSLIKLSIWARSKL